MAEWGDRITTTVGFVLHVALLPFFVASGLVVPGAVAVALVAVWVVLLALAIKRRSDERWVFATPFVAGALLVVVPTLGELLFDWTA